MSLTSKVYIGDGVYAAFDGYGVKLQTTRGDEEHWIYLEPAVLYALNQYYTRKRDDYRAAAGSPYKGPDQSDIPIASDSED